MHHTNKRWDIFCKIVDNFGDIGVCWRLSQQLAHEHQLQVRLFIDDFNVAKKIITHLNIALASQVINGVEICNWHTSEISKDIKPAHVAIETFACGLPSSYLQQMQSSNTIWINLEYLSAETWVSDFHAKPSPQPILALTKHYFFPGFLDTTGGLIRENNLIATRNEFLCSTALQKEFWQKLGIEKYEHPQTALNTTTHTTKVPIKISLFCYPQANIDKLLSALVNAEQSINIFIPTNDNTSKFNDVLANFEANDSGQVWHKGNLSVYLIQFLAQADYDRLLWACDLNFVRGEDSWIRAIWAGKPFVWQPYIQEDDTHIQKLKAFLDAYTRNATQEDKSFLFDTHLEWSKPSNTTTHIWSHLIKHLSRLETYTSKQTQALSDQSDLATKLVIFSENLMRNKV